MLYLPGGRTVVALGRSRETLALNLIINHRSIVKMAHMNSLDAPNKTGGVAITAVTNEPVNRF